MRDNRMRVLGHRCILLQEMDPARRCIKACAKYEEYENLPQVTSVAVLPDGRIVSGSSDGAVRVWDLNDTVADPIIWSWQTLAIPHRSNRGAAL